MSCPDTIPSVRERILSKKKIVIKVGTSSITYDNGKLNLRFIDQLAQQISDLMNRGIQVILVTSGAIGVGVPIIGFQEKPSYLPYKQAAAAVGQGFLMNVYERFFHEYGHHVGQVLLTKGDSLNPKRYMYARGMMMALLELGVLPIINENDAVAADEIKIGDNDTLSATVASIADADLLIILSDVDGLYDKNPSRYSDAKLIEEVPVFSRSLFRTAEGPGTARGTGGMYTKLQAAEICVHSGIDMIIARSTVPRVLYRIMDGESIGTLFVGESVHPQMKKRKMIIGADIKGTIFVDAGCRDAVLHKGSSILPVGITGTSGDFQDGDIISVSCDGEELARGITHYNRNDVDKICGVHTSEINEALGHQAPYDTVIHRDNLLVLH
mgnify:FL=1